MEYYRPVEKVVQVGSILNLPINKDCCEFELQQSLFITNS